MEKRLGIIAIVVTGKNHIAEINKLISEFSDAIIARQGIPMPRRNLSFISLIIEAPMNSINTLTGKLGRIPGVEVKTIVTKKEEGGEGISDKLPSATQLKNQESRINNL